MKLIITVALLSGPVLTAGKLVYYKGECENSVVTVGSNSIVTENDEDKTASACNQLGGKFCDRGCVIAGDKKTPDVTETSWKAACTAAGADEADLFGRDHFTQEDIENLAGC